MSSLNEETPITGHQSVHDCHEGIIIQESHSDTVMTSSRDVSIQKDGQPILLLPPVLEMAGPLDMIGRHS